MSQEIMSSLGAEGFTLLAHHAFVVGIVFCGLMLSFLAFTLYRFFKTKPEDLERLAFYVVIVVFALAAGHFAVKAIDPEGTVLTSMVEKSK